MTQSAPRIDSRLLEAIARLDCEGRPIAQTNRLVGEIAARLGVAKPSYEQVRTVVHQARNGVRSYGARDALVEISFRTAAPQVVVERLVERPRVPRNK